MLKVLADNLNLSRLGACQARKRKLARIYPYMSEAARMPAREVA